MIKVLIESVSLAYPPFKEGRLVGLLILVSFFILTIYYLYRARETIYVRPLPATEAIGESVGRAAEMGRPIVCSYGQARKGIDYWTIAAFAILEHTAEFCAKLGVKMVVPLSAEPRSLVSHPIAKSIVKEKYMIEGVPEQYDESDFRPTGNNFYAHVMTYAQILYEVQPAANVFVGNTTHVVFIAEQSASIPGNLTIGSSFYLAGCAMLAISCQHLFIAQDLIAAAAFITKEKESRGVLRNMDIGSILFIGLMLIGSILMNLGINVTTWLGV